MALGTAGRRTDGRADRRRIRQGGAPAAALFAVGIAVASCSPIEAYRSAIGVAKNDPDPQTAPFTRNLAEAEAEPYPNLASVPPPPTRATSSAERQKLTQSLLADGSATEAAGQSPALRAEVATPTAETATSAAAAPGESPRRAEASPSRDRLASATPESSGPRKPGEPPAPQPLDSSLTMPQIPSLPQPEAARPAPPPPVLSPVASPAPAGVTAPAAIVSATPQPPPPVPDLAAAAEPPVKVQPKRMAAATTVATLETSSPAEERAQIERVAALYRQKPGAVRVLAYAAAPAPGGDLVAGYRAALDRAQEVAKDLAAAGIPAVKVQTEALPAADARSAGRVEIQFAP